VKRCLRVRFRRVDALKDELHRLDSMTHLTNDEKEFLIKEKQDVLFKAVRDFDILVNDNVHRIHI
jgi:hypothetical protein